jgi:ribulose-phosphate 3-epimerase
MAVICPTVTAFDKHEYRAQMELLEPFAKRIHIDLMDGRFAPTVSPPLSSVWWPEHISADIHIMYQQPGASLELLTRLRPSLVVFHYEADVDHVAFAAGLRSAGIKAGLGVLQHTTVDDIKPLLPELDHIMIFSGKLGYHGGTPDLGPLQKVHAVRQLAPDIEIAWDGGVNDQNARELVDGGVDVLNVGGFIHKAPDPKAAYAKLEAVIGNA